MSLMVQIKRALRIGSRIVGSTVGSILFIGTGNKLAEDNSNLFWDDTNNKLGVGTNTPTATLTVANGVAINLASDDNFVIDGSTNQRAITVGAFRQLHTPAMPGTRALNYVIDANNQSDTSAIVTEYKARGFSTGDIGAIHQADIDTDNSTGGIIEAWHIEKTGDGAVDVHAIHAGVGIVVLHQDSGSFIAIEKAFTYDDSGVSFTDVTTELDSTANDIQLFVEDNDLLYIGKDTMFEAVEVLLEIAASNPGIKPEFYYWNGTVWTQFGPADGSNGFRINGNIKWDANDLSGWVTNSVNSVTKFWVYIKRTTNNLSTPPTESRIRYALPLDYSWNEDGVLNIASLQVGKASGSGIKVDNINPTFGFADLLGDQFSKNTGATKPTLTTYNGAIQCWQFSDGDEAYMTYHIGHDHVPSTDIHLHIHWSQASTTATGGTLDFKYTAIYAKGHNQVSGSVFTSTPITATFSSIDINDGDSGLSQRQHHLTEVIISGVSATSALFDRDDLEPDGVIELTFEMDANNLTNSGAVLDPFIHYVDIHYQTTSVIGTKSKSPNFYT